MFGWILIVPHLHLLGWCFQVRIISTCFFTLFSSLFLFLVYFSFWRVNFCFSSFIVESFAFIFFIFIHKKIIHQNVISQHLFCMLWIKRVLWWSERFSILCISLYMCDRGAKRAALIALSGISEPLRLNAMKSPNLWESRLPRGVREKHVTSLKVN